MEKENKKIIELTEYECNLILFALKQRKICSSFCYQRYDEAKCFEENEDGTSKCEMIRAIEEIRKKIGEKY